MSIKFKSFVKRLLIFQFAFLFIFSKVTKMKKSIRDFRKRIKFIAKTMAFSEEKMELIELKSKHFFIIIFSFYAFVAFLALMDINFAKQITGITTLVLAFIYCNPVTTIKKNFEKNNYQYDWKIYIPSMEYCIISILGIAMMLSSCIIIPDEENKEVNTKEKENDIFEKKEAKEKSD